MNDPSGMGGNVFRREWFRYVDVVPDGIVRRVGVDLNASSSERSDYTAVVEFVEAADHTLYLVGVWRERLADGHRAWLTGRTDPFEPAIAPAVGPPVGPRLCWPLGMLPEAFAGAAGDPYRGRHLSAVNIESGAFQTVFARELLRQTGLPVREVRPDRDKVTRARPLAALYEAVQGRPSPLGARPRRATRRSSSPSRTGSTTIRSTPRSTRPTSVRTGRPPLPSGAHGWSRSAAPDDVGTRRLR